MANGLFLSANALYLNLGFQYMYKLDIIDSMLDNSFDDTTVQHRKLTEFLSFNLGQNNDGSEIVQVCEYTNESDAWRHLGNDKDLLIVMFSNCTC